MTLASVAGHVYSGLHVGSRHFDVRSSALGTSAFRTRAPFGCSAIELIPHSTKRIASEASAVSHVEKLNFSSNVPQNWLKGRRSSPVPLSCPSPDSRRSLVSSP